MPGRNIIFTIGHSTHELEAFVSLLRQHGVEVIADVRSQPFSRLPEYNRDVLDAALRREGFRYVPLNRELGARRDERDCYVDGQAVYERVARLPLFQDGLERLVRGAQQHRIAIMCAEKEPLDCHRTILVARHLRSHGLRIQHILADGSIEEHTDTERRLVRRMDVAPNLFEPELTEADLIEQAYDARGRQIAYRADAEGIT
jgi:uncharacterized protein (DUF488 family)